MSARKYTPTGITGIDSMLEGLGIPKGYIVLILGSPGCGKTTFGVEFLYNGIADYDENGVLVLLEEDPELLKRNMYKFGWDLERLEQEGRLAILDASPIRYVTKGVRFGEMRIGSKEFQLISLLETIKRKVEEMDAQRLVIDSLATLTIQYPTELKRRRAILDLIQSIATMGCTTLLVSELAQSSSERLFQTEEYLAHGVILMQKVLKSGGLVHTLTIEKMRGVMHDVQPRPYKITERGIVVFPSEVVF